MTVTVYLPSGARFEVMNQDEADYIELATLNYRDTFTFENPSDVADLDAVVSNEMLCWRWSTWISREKDWDGNDIDIRHYVDAMKKMSTEVRQLKEQIGIDKKTRDRTTGDGSVPEFIARILTAARYMGIHRLEQVDLVLELAMQLRTLTTIYRNGDEEERRMAKCTAEDLIDWIINVFEPEMMLHDERFQRDVQSIWVGTL